MGKLQITGLYIYPIKSLTGVSLHEAILSDRGFAHDRKWMLVDPSGEFITQRTVPELVFFKVDFVENGFHISHVQDDGYVHLPFDEKPNQPLMKVRVWDDWVEAAVEDEEINQWFSNILKREVYLVRFPKASQRPVKGHEASLVNFSDSNQYMILGEKSIEALNERLTVPVHLNRFRPNIVFAGGEAHIEDNWKKITVGNTVFGAVKLCSRCKVISIDQVTGIVSKEPLATLAKYRVQQNKIMFGLHLKLLETGNGLVRVGAELLVN